MGVQMSEGGSSWEDPLFQEFIKPLLPDMYRWVKGDRPLSPDTLDELADGSVPSFLKSAIKALSRRRRLKPEEAEALNTLLEMPELFYDTEQMANLLQGEGLADFMGEAEVERKNRENTEALRAAAEAGDERVNVASLPPEAPQPTRDGLSFLKGIIKGEQLRDVVEKRAASDVAVAALLEQEGIPVGSATPVQEDRSFTQMGEGVRDKFDPPLSFRDFMDTEGSWIYPDWQENTIRFSLLGGEVEANEYAYEMYSRYRTAENLRQVAELDSQYGTAKFDEVLRAAREQELEKLYRDLDPAKDQDIIDYLGALQSQSTGEGVSTAQASAEGNEVVEVDDNALLIDRMFLPGTTIPRGFMLDTGLTGYTWGNVSLSNDPYALQQVFDTLEARLGLASELGLSNAWSFRDALKFELWLSGQVAQTVDTGDPVRDSFTPKAQALSAIEAAYRVRNMEMAPGEVVRVRKDEEAAINALFSESDATGVDMAKLIMQTAWQYGMDFKVLASLVAYGSAGGTAEGFTRPEGWVRAAAIAYQRGIRDTGDPVLAALYGTGREDQARYIRENGVPDARDFSEVARTITGVFGTAMNVFPGWGAQDTRIQDMVTSFNQQLASGQQYDSDLAGSKDRWRLVAEQAFYQMNLRQPTASELEAMMRVPAMARMMEGRRMGFVVDPKAESFFDGYWESAYSPDWERKLRDVAKSNDTYQALYAAKPLSMTDEEYQDSIRLELYRQLGFQPPDDLVAQSMQQGFSPRSMHQAILARPELAKESNSFQDRLVSLGNVLKEF